MGVCAHELGDPQLALFLARLLEGEQGPLQQSLLSKELMPGQHLPLLQVACLVYDMPGVMTDMSSAPLTISAWIVAVSASFFASCLICNQAVQLLSYLSPSFDNRCTVHEECLF